MFLLVLLFIIFIFTFFGLFLIVSWTGIQFAHITEVLKEIELDKSRKTGVEYSMEMRMRGSAAVANFVDGKRFELLTFIRHMMAEGEILYTHRGALNLKDGLKKFVMAKAGPLELLNAMKNIVSSSLVKVFNSNRPEKEKMGDFAELQLKLNEISEFEQKVRVWSTVDAITAQQLFVYIQMVVDDAARHRCAWTDIRMLRHEGVLHGHLSAAQGLACKSAIEITAFLRQNAPGSINKATLGITEKNFASLAEIPKKNNKPNPKNKNGGLSDAQKRYLNVRAKEEYARGRRDGRNNANNENARRKRRREVSSEPERSVEPPRKRRKKRNTEKKNNSNEDDDGVRICRYWESGRCKWGEDKCKFEHLCSKCKKKGHKRFDCPEAY